ncbi:C-type lectin family protein [Fowlpox virus]|uniref:C-type lectin family protein n=1 Tax=Fowlpox virus TaxID=10261 RepID=A0A891M1C9_FOWPV|nr:C-type lectin family protein [Fowlpox virus]UHJ15098.1 C-type lectin family protein [Fowlpox virus]UHJ15355.1 C-type lectin family protein [Fowlpox virus]
MCKKARKRGLLTIAFTILLFVIILVDIDRDRYLVRCGKDWLEFDNLCYFISENKLSWDDSMMVCDNLGGGNNININTNSGLLNTSKDYWIKIVDELDCTNINMCNFLYSNIVGCDICTIEKSYICIKPINKINLFSYFVEYTK